MKDNISPEEKLLKLIKGDKKLPVEKKDSPLQPALKITAKKNDPGPIGKNLAHFLIGKIKPLLIIGSLIYLVAAFVYPWVGLKKINLPVISEKMKQTPQAETKKESKPFEFYLKGMQGRQIFGTFSGKEEGQAAQVAAEADSIKDINLMGVILGDNPQAIIEDKKTQKTVYVSRGQFIGQFQVEEIKEGKVILNYKGQRYELGV
ncbi:MAG: type II secretion system protein N [Candidatus Omnitrophica bacterium]|nr:type II secretion system protein N [Candidatus Omnitrophota bacterium]